MDPITQIEDAVISYYAGLDDAQKANQAQACMDVLVSVDKLRAGMSGPSAAPAAPAAPPPPPPPPPPARPGRH